MNRNHCNNCGDKVPKDKRRDAIYCDHPCRMVVANARNHGVYTVARVLAARMKPAPRSTPISVKEIEHEWKKWTPPDGIDGSMPLKVKPDLRSEEIMRILEELHG